MLRGFYSGISNTPFHKHMLDATMKSYIVPVVCILTKLVRYSWLEVDNFNFVIANLEEKLQNGAEESQVVQQIHQLLLKMWTTAWPKWLDTSRITDPTEAGLALLTLNQDGSFKEPKDVTKIIAKLEYCMRLTFLREIRARADFQGDNVTETKACDALQPWFTEKTHSTFARLRSLQHRASAIAYETMGLPRIWWMDTDTWLTLKYKGNSISFLDVCSMFRDVEEDLVSVWEHKVLRGLHLRVDYNDMADDVTNKDVGYSFLFDPRNTCFEDRTRLVQAVVQGEDPFSHFLLKQDGELIWNRAALRGWLQDYAELQKLLLLRAEMLSGAPSRGTELTAMTYRNIQTRSTRNLLVFGQHVTLLSQYSKTTALTGHEKLIPHGLDAITSDILIQDLAIARPFAQLAAKICFQDESIVQLYRDLIFVNFNKMFSSEDLSAVMAKYSLRRVQFALTINPWRHIQTAWKRKFKCATEDIAVMDKEEDVEALQAGHTRAMENRIYGLSTQSLAGAAEDVLPLFLQASKAWQERCRVMPGGTGLPYSQCRADMFTKPDTLPNKPSTSSVHNLAHDCAINQEAMVESITTRVVERLTPMLTELMHGLTRVKNTAEPRASRPASPDMTAHYTTQKKGKQKEVVVASNANIEAEDLQEGAQRAIMSSVCEAGKMTPQTTLDAHTFLVDNANMILRQNMLSGLTSTIGKSHISHINIPLIIPLQAQRSAQSHVGTHHHPLQHQTCRSWLWRKYRHC